MNLSIGSFHCSLSALGPKKTKYFLELLIEKFAQAGILVVNHNWMDRTNSSEKVFQVGIEIHLGFKVIPAIH